MSTIVYQGLHSYFESQLVETTTLKLRVASCMVGYEPKEAKEKCQIQETNYKPPCNEYTGWSSIQKLSNVSYAQKEITQKQNSYVHPLTKTSPKLSQRSLELCTENLGCETGCDTIDISILSLNNSNNSINVKTPLNQDHHQNAPKQMSSRSRKSPTFPPPLTTMRSPNPIQVRPYREDGRLIIEAFETPSRNTYLHAERSNGRLVLSFVTDSADILETEMTNEDNENDATEANEREINHEDNYHEEQIFDYQETEPNFNEGMDGNIQISGRCKESQHENKSSCFWNKPLCVAMSTS